MIIKVEQSNVEAAATIHSISWKQSHISFCSPDFINLHSPEHQKEYLENKMRQGSVIYMLIAEKPVGIVSVNGNLIEDLYVLPEFQNRGYGSELLKYAMRECTGNPTLWILENNKNAAKLYRRTGFSETGRRNSIANKFDEIEFSLGNK